MYSMNRNYYDFGCINKYYVPNKTLSPGVALSARNCSDALLGGKLIRSSIAMRVLYTCIAVLLPLGDGVGGDVG